VDSFADGPRYRSRGKNHGMQIVCSVSRLLGTMAPRATAQLDGALNAATFWTSARQALGGHHQMR